MSKGVKGLKKVVAKVNHPPFINCMIKSGMAMPSPPLGPTLGSVCYVLLFSPRSCPVHRQNVHCFYKKNIGKVWQICDISSSTCKLLTGLRLFVVSSPNFIAAIVNTSMVDSQPSPEQYQHRHNKTTTTDWCMLYWYHWNLYTCRLDATCLSRFARTWGEMLLSFAPFSSYKK